MSNVEQVTYTQVKAHKGGARLWIEGAKLVTSGFTRGSRYNRHITDGRIDLKLHPEGEFKVSGRERNGKEIPIIDMALGKHTDKFPDGTRIRAVFVAGQINITLHHEDANKARREERFKKNLLDNTLTEASACTGGGISTAAIHQAMEDAGINSKVAFVVDCELKYLQSAFAQNFAITDDTLAIEAKLEEVECHLLPEVDVFSFSLPCAGFSISGKSKHGLSPEDHSGTSLFGIRNIIAATNPAVIVSENVTQAKGSPMYTLLLLELQRLGYDVIEGVLDNTFTGTFENRPRYWFIAYSRGLPAECFADAFNFRLGARYSHLAQLMDTDVPDEMWADNQYLKDKQIRDAEAGKGFATRQLLDGSATKVGTIGRYYNKRRSTEPFIVNGTGQERLLTLAEHARCKSVPERLVAQCNATTGHEILGQSIDYLQAYEPVRRCMVALRRWLGLDMAEAV